MRYNIYSMADDQQQPQSETPDHISQLAETNPDGNLPHLPHRHSAHKLPPEADAATSSSNKQPSSDGADRQSNTGSTDASDSKLHMLSSAKQLEIEEGEPNLLPKRFHTGRTAAASVMGLAILAGLAATWFHYNQGTYSLGGSASQIATTTPTPNSPATLGAETNAPQTLTLTLALPSLTQGHYQAWVNHSDQIRPLGAFKPAENNQVQRLDGTPFNPQAAVASKDTVFITIEPGEDEVSAPSKSVILTGTLNTQGQANMSFKAIDLSKASGVFTLATPTSPDSDPKTGLWFAKTDGQTLTGPGLNLPDAPTGWKYEGQVIFKGVAVEIGRFAKPDRPDEFNKFTLNPDKTPNFPGEDFLQKSPGQLGMDFPIDLTTGEWQVVISLEPDNDGQDPTGSDMFFLQPLKADIAQGAEAHKEHPLSLNLKDFPSGTATFK